MKHKKHKLIEMDPKRFVTSLRRMANPYDEFEIDITRFHLIYSGRDEYHHRVFEIVPGAPHPHDHLWMSSKRARKIAANKSEHQGLLAQAIAAQSAELGRLSTAPAAGAAAAPAAGAAAAAAPARRPGVWGLGDFKRSRQKNSRSGAAPAAGAAAPARDPGVYSLAGFPGRRAAAGAASGPGGIAEFNVPENVNINEQRRLLSRFVAPPPRRNNINYAALENVVVPNQLTEEQVLERLSGLVQRGLRHGIANANRPNAIRSVLEAFPIENRRITNTGIVMYNKADLDAIIDLSQELYFPISLAEGIELQQRVREITGADTSLTAEEANDPEYCRPLPMTEGGSCPACMIDETAERRLFKLHYTHSDTQVLCLICIFRYFLAESPIETRCFLSLDECKRIITEYQFYRTIYFNQTPEKLGDVAPLVLTQDAGFDIAVHSRLANLPLRDAFMRIISERRAAFETDAANKRRIAEDARRLREEAERAAAIEAERAAAEAARVAAAAEAAERERLERERRRRAQIELFERHRAANVASRRLGTNTAREKVGVIDFSTLSTQTMCPYCFDPVAKIEGCIYLKHKNVRGDSIPCPRGSIDAMLSRFPTLYGVPEWCEICGRPCQALRGMAHNHLPLQGGEPIPHEGHYYAGNPAQADFICRSAGGGGRVEYFVRINALRDTLIEAYNSGSLIWDDVMKDQAVRKTLEYLGSGPRPGQTLEAWQNTQPQYIRAQQIMRRGRWDNELPPPPVMPPPINAGAAAAGAAAAGAAAAGETSSILGFLGGLAVDYLLRPVRRLCSVRREGGGTRRRYRLQKKIGRKNKTRKNR
jgi:hypothetical protein